MMFFIVFLLLLTRIAISISESINISTDYPSTPICIIGSGIGGASVAHFIRRHSPSPLGRIRIFERNLIVGGRMATVTIGGDTFEAGASILHPKNFHALNFSKLLNLKANKASSAPLSFGIWDGNKFIFKTLTVDIRSSISQKFVSFTNSIRLLWRYGFSLFKMDSFVEATVNRFLNYYKNMEAMPIFETVDEMLKWSGLYNLTQWTLQDELNHLGLSPSLIHELVTVITRINYGQSVSISGLGGAVSLAGSGGGLWSIEGGNWQIVAGLINGSDVDLHLNEAIDSINNLGEYYELKSSEGNNYACEVTVVATPLDESSISFVPPISIPARKLHHTHATFVRGLLNHEYFGMGEADKVPDLVGTVEDPALQFLCIGLLKRYNENDAIYKIFSREPMPENFLDRIFWARNETIRINWGAYPHYDAPEVFAPFILDGHHLYYINAFENAASTMETSAVAAQNIMRLILSKRSGTPIIRLNTDNADTLHSDL